MINASNFGTVSRNLPQPQPDTGEADMRLSRYADQSIGSLIPTKHVGSDEGSYYIASNPTPGTALAYNVQTTFSDTVPFLQIVNNDSSANPSYKRIYIDYIKIIVTTPAAAGTQAYYAIKADVTPRAITGSNTLLIVPTSPNSDMPATSVAVLNVQNNSAATAISASSGSARVLARGAFGGLTVIGDELVIVCGSQGVGSYAGLTAVQAVCPGRKSSNSPPIIIGPRQSAVVHLWFPGNTTTGLSYELEMGWWER